MNLLLLFWFWFALLGLLGRGVRELAHVVVSRHGHYLVLLELNNLLDHLIVTFFQKSIRNSSVAVVRFIWYSHVDDAKFIHEFFHLILIPDRDEVLLCLAIIIHQFLDELEFVVMICIR